jgi:hypothetical protein
MFALLNNGIKASFTHLLIRKSTSMPLYALIIGIISDISFDVPPILRTGGNK